VSGRGYGRERREDAARCSAAVKVTRHGIGAIILGRGLESERGLRSGGFTGPGLCVRWAMKRTSSVPTLKA
jgi:hypothetical protein